MRWIRVPGHLKNRPTRRPSPPAKRRPVISQEPRTFAARRSNIVNMDYQRPVGRHLPAPSTPRNPAVAVSTSPNCAHHFRRTTSLAACPTRSPSSHGS
ncbi:hypothetical protein SCHPADRAFT_538099 [Schizopora paradoxa]|uniref:Uncharacterized protein n=1 Tax=Schizopora paradoxa TaxID=27342 RepID=A0A0H2RE01_9AGAM|nr:hypothetical protein SCHPADRAFT_538099 [Schizopora paradoxa]